MRLRINFINYKIKIYAIVIHFNIINTTKFANRAYDKTF